MLGLGHRTLGSIHQHDVEAWIAELNTRRKPATVRLVFGILSRLMQLAVDRGKLTSNPCAGVKLIPVDNEEMQFLSQPRLHCWPNPLTRDTVPTFWFRLMGAFEAERWRPFGLLTWTWPKAALMYGTTSVKLGAVWCGDRPRHDGGSGQWSFPKKL